MAANFSNAFATRFSLGASTVSQNVAGLTISFWSNPTSVASNAFQVALSTGASTTLTRAGIVYITSAVRFDARRLDADSLSSLSHGTMTINNWQHIVGVWDYANGNLHGYRNNVKGTLAIASWTGGNSENTASLNAYIGSAPGAATPYVIGSLDDVRIYDRALSDGEVQQLFDLKGADKIITGLKHRYTMAGTGNLSSIQDLGSLQFQATGQGNSGVLPTGGTGVIRYNNRPLGRF